MGCTPRAVRRRRRTVNKPKRLSSWLNTRTGRVFAGGITCWRRSPQAAWNAGIASRFFCVTRPGRFELGFEAGAHQGIERFVFDGDPMRLPHPLAEGLVRSKACWALQGL